jgi:hypothetical protein
MLSSLFDGILALGVLELRAPWDTYEAAWVRVLDVAWQEEAPDE